MATVNSTFDCSNVDQPKPGDMSVDGSLIEKESPPPFITFRKGMSSNNEINLREEFREQFNVFRTEMTSLLENWFRKQDEKFSVLLTEFDSVKTSIQFVSDKCDELDKKSQETATRVRVLEKKQQTNEQYITVLQAKLENIEQKSRSCNVEISNLPEKRGENLISIIENIGNIINQPVTSRDIIAVHRVPQMNQKSTQPKNIVVKFSSQISRDNFISAARLKKGITSDELKIHGTVQKVYINEHLTQQNKKLFRRARELAKQNGHRFVWIKHGVILVRPDVPEAVFSIRTEEDLSKIKPYNPKH